MWWHPRTSYRWAPRLRSGRARVPETARDQGVAGRRLRGRPGRDHPGRVTVRRRGADEVFYCATSIRCAGEFGEKCCEPVPSVDVQPEFVVAAAVLDERVNRSDHSTAAATSAHTRLTQHAPVSHPRPSAQSSAASTGDRAGLIHRGSANAVRQLRPPRPGGGRRRSIR